MSDKSDLDVVEELFKFLQGTLPDGYKVPAREIPRLTAAKAWTVVWYLGNLYHAIPDTIERCVSCGDLFDTRSGGTCIDYGPKPHGHFCDTCDPR